MSLVVPSLVVKIIDRLFPFTATQKDGESVKIDFQYAESLAGIVHLIDQIPQELLALNDTEYIEYTLNLEAIKSSVKSYEQRGNVNALNFLPNFNRLNPLTIVRRALEKCPDQFPSKSTTGLYFINDDDLRDSIRLDISTAEQAFRNGEWKASTVLTGSVIEALLLWRLKQQDPLSLKRIAGIDINKLDDMRLQSLIEISNKVGIIKNETFTLVSLTRNFRNLIHPGRSIRLGQACNRGTALTALAALEGVVNDIS